MFKNNNNKNNINNNQYSTINNSKVKKEHFWRFSNRCWPHFSNVNVPLFLSGFGIKSSPFYVQPFKVHWHTLFQHRFTALHRIFWRNVAGLSKLTHVKKGITMLETHVEIACGNAAFFVHFSNDFVVLRFLQQQRVVTTTTKTNFFDRKLTS